VLVALLGATVILGTPLAAQADQGKWWNPEQGGKKAQPRHEAYRAPAWHDHGAYHPGPRFSRPWYGTRVYRDRTWVGSGRGYHGRPVYGWRYYSAPRYVYGRNFIYVRPVRFFVSAGAVIGRVSIHAGYSDPGPIYGCNFCDERFTSYEAYQAHVAHCPDAPHGYRVMARDWNQDQWNDSQDNPNGHWERDGDE
jgi:hypothetical protein